MKNIIKMTSYSAIALSSVAYASAIDYGKDKVGKGLQNGETDLPTAINNFLEYLLLFLGLIAIAIFLWAGFNIMTAGGDDDKVKKGKTTMINAAIGIIVIFMSWQIVNWIFGVAESGGGTQ